MKIEGVRASMEPGSAAHITTLIPENKAGFNVVRNTFGSAFSTYRAAAIGIARDISARRFFRVQGCSKRCHQAIHDTSKTESTLSSFAIGQACISDGHLLVAECTLVHVDSRLRFYPGNSRNSLTIAKILERS
jgi:hypothetical protein